MNRVFVIKIMEQIALNKQEYNLLEYNKGYLWSECTSVLPTNGGA